MGAGKPAMVGWWGFLQYWYLQWELNTSLYMLEPSEKAIVNSITVSILAILVYAAATYLPGHLVMMVHFLLHNDHVTEEVKT